MGYYEFPNVIVSGGSVVCYGSWGRTLGDINREKIGNKRSQRTNYKGCPNRSDKRIDYNEETES